MKKHAILIFLLMLCPISNGLLNSITVIKAGSGDPSLKNLQANWSVETLYKKTHNPYALCVDGNGDVLFLDSERQEIMKIDEKGNITTYASTGSVFFDFWLVETMGFGISWLYVFWVVCSMLGGIVGCLGGINGAYVSRIMIEKIAKSRHFA